MYQIRILYGTVDFLWIAPRTDRNHIRLGPNESQWMIGIRAEPDDRPTDRGAGCASRGDGAEGDGKPALPCRGAARRSRIERAADEIRGSRPSGSLGELAGGGGPRRLSHSALRRDARSTGSPPTEADRQCS